MTTKVRKLYEAGYVFVGAANNMIAATAQVESLRAKGCPARVVRAPKGSLLKYDVYAKLKAAKNAKPATS